MRGTLPEMFSGKIRLLLGLLILLMLLPACSALVIGPNLNAPAPTADIDATVQAVLQATAEARTGEDHSLAFRIVVATESAQVLAASPSESEPELPLAT